MKTLIIFIVVLFSILGIALFYEQQTIKLEIHDILTINGFKEITFQNPKPHLCSNDATIIGFKAMKNNKIYSGNVCQNNKEMKIKIYKEFNV